MNTAVLMVWRMGPKYGLQESSRDPSPGSRRPTVSGRVAVIRRGGRSLWFPVSAPVRGTGFVRYAPSGM